MKIHELIDYILNFYGTILSSGVVILTAGLVIYGIIQGFKENP
jgi:hypothetical protein